MAEQQPVTSEPVAEGQQPNSIPTHRIPGRPWKPGQSGNPKGRPPVTRMVAEVCREILDADRAEFRISKHGKKSVILSVNGAPDIRHAIVASLVYSAVNLGDTAAARELFDRCDGKVPNTVKLTTGSSLSSLTEEALAKREQELQALLSTGEQPKQ